MDRFQSMQVFARVVQMNSFTKAADSLSLPRASVTTIVQSLERLLGVRLLNRTTRSLSLTTEGSAYYERCLAILADVQDIEATLAYASSKPKGRLRVDMPGSIGRLIVIPSLHRFHAEYPDIELVLGLGDRPVDLVTDGVDCVIRVGELRDSSLVARRVGVFQGVTCASPEYLACHGEPTTLESLQQHQAVHYFSSRNGRQIDWEFTVDGKPLEVKMNGSVSVNDADAYVTCGVEGLGLIQPALFMVRPLLQSGQLREVLPAWKPSPMAISVVYPHSRHLSPKVRVFTDWIAGIFEGCPLLNGSWDGSGELPPCGEPANAPYTGFDSAAWRQDRHARPDRSPLAPASADRPYPELIM